MEAKVIKRPSNHGGGIQTPNRLIIHAMGQYIIISKSDSRWYKENKNIDIPVGIHHAVEFLDYVGLSAHFLIEPNGDLMNLRKTTEIAYHAKSNNTDTVGIEILLEGEWNYPSFKKEMLSGNDWITVDQYKSLIEISNDIVEYFDMDVEKGVLRHSDISPGRKIDPGVGVKWNWYKKQLI